MSELIFSTTKPGTVNAEYSLELAAVAAIFIFYIPLIYAFIIYNRAYNRADNNVQADEDNLNAGNFCRELCNIFLPMAPERRARRRLDLRQGK